MRNFLSFFLLVTTVLSIEIYDSCFKRVSRRAIGNYAPIAEYRQTALSMCLQHCITAAGNGPNGGSVCKAISYESKKQLCKLFDNDGHKIPAVIYPIVGIDIFYRTSDSNECSGPISGTQVNPNFVVLGGHKKISIKSQLAKNEEKLLTGFDVPTTSSDNFFKKARALSSPIQKMDDLDDVLRSRLRGEKKLVPMDVLKERQEFERTDSPLKCKISSGYYVVVGNEIVLPISGGDVKVYNEVEQGDCAKYCSQNRGPDGAMINCRSLNYFPTTQKCELYAILAEPHGTGKLLENENVIYAEKFCLPESSYICQNDEIFILHIQKSFQRAPLAKESASSITDCLRLCMNDESCQSSVFITKSKECQLFDVNASAEEYLTDSNEESVLIENGCRRGDAKPKRRVSETKTERNTDGWSGCDFKVDGHRVRVRTDEDGQIETERC